MNTINENGSCDRKKAGIIRADLLRFFTPEKLAAGILLVALILVYSVADNLFMNDFLASDAVKSQSILDNIMGALLFDRCKPLLVLAVSVFTVPSYAYDFRNHYTPYLLERGGLRSYVFSMMQSVFLYTMITLVLGFYLAGLFLRLFMVMQTKNSYSGFGFYQGLAESRFAWFYLGIIAFNFALSTVPLCCAGILVSVRKPDIYVALGSTFFLFYILQNLTSGIPYIFSYAQLGAEPGTFGIWDSLYHVIYFSLWQFAVSALIYRAMKRRRDDGVL